MSYTFGTKNYVSVAEPTQTVEIVQIGNLRRLIKRAIDVTLALSLMPVLLAVLIVVWCLNRFYNRGPLFFLQKRMGYGCSPITVIKLRTMLPERRAQRRANDPLERDRITPLGATLRKTRLDELPQILNVLRGDMSLIGPRPDAWDHALQYNLEIADYHKRHAVLPGISGLAQVEIGYAEGVDATRAKVAADIQYIETSHLGTDLWLIWKTIITVISFRGA